MKLYETKHLDEDHPMTRMMTKAYEKNISENSDETKADEKEETCRGCGKPEVTMKGLCKQCAEDTYADRD